MKCLVCGKDIVPMNNINKYCWEHYQIYDNLMKLYQQVFKAYGSLAWTDYLTKILDDNNKENWKSSLLDPSNKKTLSIVTSVARAEMDQEKM
jgi:hypothetical protein